jgi:hypothetical protein
LEHHRPDAGVGDSEGEDDDGSAKDNDGGELSIEAQIANELSAMKRPKKEPRFGKPLLLHGMVALAHLSGTLLNRPSDTG